jgi:hypothetical protein
MRCVKVSLAWFGLALDWRQDTPRRWMMGGMPGGPVGAVVLALTAGSGLVNPEEAAAGPVASCTASSGESGFVGDASGRATANVSVDLYAEPTEAALRRLTVGGAARLARLGASTTDAAGCFGIPMASASAWLARADRLGRVDLRLVIHRPGQIEMRVVPVVLTTSTTSGALRVSAGAEATGSVPALSEVDAAAPVEGGLTESFDGTTGESAGEAPRASVANVMAAGTAFRAAATDTTGTSTAASSDLAPAPLAMSALSSGGLRWVLRKDFGTGRRWSASGGAPLPT